jgi:hypothetical protein
MVIVIDIVIDPKTGIQGLMTYNTDGDELGPHRDPTDSSKSIDGFAFLSWLNADKARRVKGGWEEVSTIPGLPEFTTRWGVLVNQAIRSDADQRLSALKLK